MHKKLAPFSQWSTDSHSFHFVRAEEDESVNPIEQSKPFLSMLLSGTVLVNNSRKQVVIRPGTFAMYSHGFDKTVTALAPNTTWVLFRCPPEYVNRIQALSRSSCDRQTDPQQMGKITSLTLRIAKSSSDDQAWDIAHRFNELFESYLVNENALLSCSTTAIELKQLLHDRLDQFVGLSETANQMQRNVSHLARSFKKHFGVTIGQYLRSIRCQKALFELGRQELSLAEIASATGFADQSHLCRAFKSYCGTTPGAYRKFLSSSWR